MPRPTGKKHGSNRNNMQNIIDKLGKSCNFERSEIELLLLSFKEITNYETKHPKDKIDRVKFRDLLHNYFDLMDDLLLDRIFKCFDQDNDSYISQEEWVKGMSVFVRGTLEERCKFCFMVYDMSGSGHIAKEEMFQLLKNCIIKQQSDEDPDEGVRDLVDLVLKKMDTEHKARVTVDEYSQTVKDESLLLECFGPCLPSDKTTKAFNSTFTDERERKHLVRCAKNAGNMKSRPTTSSAVQQADA